MAPAHPLPGQSRDELPKWQQCLFELASVSAERWEQLLPTYSMASDAINADGFPKSPLNKHHSSLHPLTGSGGTLQLLQDMRKTAKAPAFLQ